MSQNVPNMLENTIAKIREMVDVNSVIGNPITTPDGITIIPISKVTYGFASGGSDFPSRNNVELFGGGGAESPYCSFHASYLRKDDGTLKALPRRQSQCSCMQSSDARQFVAKQWSQKPQEADCCCEDTTAEVCCEDSCCSEMPVSDDCCTDSCCCETSSDNCCASSVSDCCNTSSLDAFLRKAEENTFTVSGMLFQDSWNLDLDRLRRCYICEVDTEHGMVPFCAYNLTDINGKALYRK